jgi:hypothetical protein
MEARLRNERNVPSHGCGLRRDLRPDPEDGGRLTSFALAAMNFWSRKARQF